MRLALVVREARGWCGRRGTAIGCQHRADAHGTALKWRCACLRARGDVRAVFTRCAWRGSCRAPAARGSACGSVGVPVGAWEGARRAIIFGVLKELLFTACVHERVSGVSFDDFLRSPSVLTSAFTLHVCVRCRAAEAVSRGYQTETGTHRSSCWLLMCRCTVAARSYSAWRTAPPRRAAGQARRADGRRPAVVTDDPPTER